MDSTKTEKDKSKRDMLIERIRVRHPELDLEDDEVVSGRIVEDYEDFDKRIEDYDKRERALSDMFTSDPRTATIMQAFVKGEHPMTSFVRQFGKDLAEAAGDPDKADEIAEAHAEYLERVAKENQLKEQSEGNIKKSLELLGEIEESGEMSAEEIDKAVDFLTQIADKVIMGIVDKGMIDLALKAINHDDNVQYAREEGVVSGRNEKIELKKKSLVAGDGVPHLGGNSTKPEQPKTDEPEDILDIAHRLKRR